MKALEILYEYCDELDRHYISPERPLMLFLDPDNFRQLEEEVKNSNVIHKYEPVETLRMPTDPVRYEPMLFVSIVNYRFNVFQRADNSLIWDAIKIKLAIPQ